MRDLSSKRQNGKGPTSVTLRLNHIHDLFAMPRHNAFQDNYLPLAGIDQIALQLRYARLRNGLHVTFILPTSDDEGTDLHAEIQAALQRYCNVRLDNLLIDLMTRRLTVVRSLQVGVLILGICLALAATISRAEGIVEWLRTLLSNSVSIFGSVALWSPADAFLFSMRPMYNGIEICSAVREMTFDIQYEKPTSNFAIPEQPIYLKGRK